MTPRPKTSARFGVPATRIPNGPGQGLTSRARVVVRGKARLARRTSAETRRRAEGGGLVGVLPGEARFVTAEVAVGGGLPVDGPAQVQLLHQGGRPQVEMVADQAGDRGPVDLLGAEGLDQQRQRP